MPASRDLILNPWFQRSSSDFNRLPFLEAFTGLADMAWIFDKPSNALLPFGLNSEWLPYIAYSSPGEPVSTEIPAHVQSVLSYANLFVRRDYVIRRQLEWQRSIAEKSAFFAEHAYVALPGLLHPFHMASLRRYYRDLLEAGEFSSEDAGQSSRLWLHNDVMARFFQHQLTSMVSQIAAQPVQSSYTYVACYQGGDSLAKHIDREQCEFTISLCLDFIPEPEELTSWPIHLETDNGTVAIQQALGDALLFRGRELPHYRDELPKDCTSTSVLFHFVPCGFTGRLD